jgi:hypothetical protein
MRISRPACQHKAAVAIAAFDDAAFINLKPDARMAKGGTAGNVTCAITGDAAGFDGNGFRLVNHDGALSNGVRRAQFLSLLIVERDCEIAHITAFGLAGLHPQGGPHREVKNAGA